MRGRADEPDLWGELYERFRRPGTPPRRRAGTRLSPDARGRLIDAGLGVLASIRTLVDVAEEVLEDRRTRLDDEPAGPEPWVRAPEDAGRRPTATREGGVVRDIPFGGA